ncbi:MAG: hypothetical protein NC124_04150 [Clostridium sp.]|nr:hypothetical protein [Clostridium sp.]
MDENYLDNLLNEVSLDKEIDRTIEDELDNQMAMERKQHMEKNAMSSEDLFNMDLERDADLTALENDLTFSEDQMEELDKLENMADLDMGDMDFSDIDFDDLDMTKLDEDIETDDLQDLLKDFEGDLEIADSFHTEQAESAAQEENVADKTGQSEQPDADKDNSVQDNVPEPLNDSLNEDDFDTDQFLDSLLEEPAEKEDSLADILDLGQQEQNEETETEAGGDDAGAGDDIMTQEELNRLLDSMTEEPESASSESTDSLPPESMDSSSTEKEAEDVLSALETDTAQASAEGDPMDDLFSLLDMDDSDGNTEQAETSEGSVPENPELEDIAELPEKPADNGKKTFMQILFGDPDEDDILSEEELAAIDAKKEAKRAKKEAAKQAKQEKKEAAKAEKSLKNSQKQKENDEKQRVKAQKKAERKAEEEANAEPEKQLNRPMTIFIFSVFIGGALLYYLGLNNFDYSQAIKKATDYFANRRYHRAYDEIKGVEVKEDDQDLKDRIYTVMYVERLYEAFQNNIRLGFQEKALDSLLRGVGKYYEHYDEAVELGIVADLDYSFGQIQNVLATQYGITVEQAMAINSLSNYEYVQVLGEYVSQYPLVDLDTVIPETSNTENPSGQADGETESTAAAEAGSEEEQTEVPSEQPDEEVKE